MSNWPAQLPQKQFMGVSVQDDESRLVTAMDAGPSTIRNRYTAITKSLNAPIILTGAQLAIFNTFLRTTLNHGTNSFTWTDPETDDSVSFRFKTKPRWQCIRPNADPDLRLWQGSLDLEILP